MITKSKFRLALYDFSFLYWSINGNICWFYSLKQYGPLKHMDDVREYGGGNAGQWRWTEERRTLVLDGIS
jgi:hypothetical protein